MNRNVYALQGVFFQHNWAMAIGHNVTIGEAVAIVPQMMMTMFHAVVGKTEFSESIVGMMADQYGESSITDFVMTETKMSYTKKYMQRRDMIYYEFTEKRGDVWYGKWHGSDVGEGTTKCIVNEVAETFLIPESELENLQLN